MSRLRNYLDKVKPRFEPGGKYQALQSVFDGLETFLYTPRTTSGRRYTTHIHDSIDSKRTMTIVILALMPCFVFGMYNIGYQHWLAAGVEGPYPFFSLLLYGFLTVLPRLAVAYITGLGIEFIVAQKRHEEIQEGFLVTGILIPMICPPEIPLWMLAAATAFAVIFAKEVFGGTGYNIFNVALVTRAFLFFAYPAHMSGDKVFVAAGQPFGFGPAVADGFTCATPLGQLSQGITNITGTGGHAISAADAFIGLMPGCMGETSTLLIIIGGILLTAAGIASWRVMLSVFVGALAAGFVANAFPSPAYPLAAVAPWEQLLYGGLAFAAVFMATDPVTSARTAKGKYIYGFLTGAIAVIIRTYNNGYPEGAMLAVLLMNCFAPLIDWCVVEANVRRRMARMVHSQK